MKRIIISFVFILFSYLWFAAAAWQFNNPKANEMTFFTHFKEALTFQICPEFQIGNKAL